jgi:hypothetical protein
MARKFKEFLLQETSWTLRALLLIVIVIFFVGCPIIFTRVLTSDSNRDFVWFFTLLMLPIAAISSLVGSITTLFTTSRKMSDFQELIVKADSALNNINSQTQHCQKYTNALQQATTRIHGIVQVALEKFGHSIIDYPLMSVIEGAVKEHGEIWVLTAALELEGEELGRVIQDNLRKKVKYLYLIPDEAHLREKMQRLAKSWKPYCTIDPREQIKCFIVPKHFVYMTVIIYNPYAKIPTVLVKFPKSDVYAKDKYPFIYRVDSEPKEAWEIFRNAIQELITNDGQMCKIVRRLNIDFS